MKRTLVDDLISFIDLEGTKRCITDSKENLKGI